MSEDELLERGKELAAIWVTHSDPLFGPIPLDDIATVELQLYLVWEHLDQMLVDWLEFKDVWDNQCSMDARVPQTVVEGIAYGVAAMLDILHYEGNA